MNFSVPVDFEVTATNGDKADKAIVEFLMASIREFGLDYGIKDFVLPVGYATEGGSIDSATLDSVEDW